MKGICPKCGTVYYGWALTNPREQKCDQCGSNLEISNDRECIRTRYSAFSYPKYKITFNKMKEMIMAN